MNNLNKLANKFAMKLGLESNYSYPESGKHYLADPIEISETEPFVSQETLDSETRLQTEPKYRMRQMQIHFHKLSEKIDLADWNGALEEVRKMGGELWSVKEFVESQIAK